MRELETKTDKLWSKNKAFYSHITHAGVVVTRLPLVWWLSWFNTGLPCSTLAGPTLMVLKLLRRKYCLCNDICKWLDSLVFSDKDDKPYALSHNLQCSEPCVGRKRTDTLFAKSRVWSSRCCGLSPVVYHGRTKAFQDETSFMFRVCALKYC